jgi:hypothetical protein
MTWNKSEYATKIKYLRELLLTEIGCCEECGYSRFESLLEIAHIKHGPEIEKLSASNVFLLCKNCHVGFDRGLMRVKGKWSDSQFNTHKKEVAKQNNAYLYYEGSPPRARLLK